MKIIFFLVAMCSTVFGTEFRFGVDNWSGIANEAREIPPEKLSDISSINVNKALRQIVDDDDPAVFQEMARDWKDPFVQSLGVYLLGRKPERKDLAVQAAIYATLSTPQPGFEGFQYVDELLRKADIKYYDIVKNYLIFGRCDRSNLILLFGWLPAMFSEKLILDKDYDTIPLDCQALLIDRVCLELQKKHKEIPEAYEKKLERLNRYPGFPRLMYLIHADDNSPGYLSCLLNVVSNSDITDGEFDSFIILKQHEIEMNVDKIKAVVSPSRLSSINDLLNRQAPQK